MSADYLQREYSGGCQCGAVRYHARRLGPNPHLCHCRMCQKAVGNLFASLVRVKREDIGWTRGAPATFRSSAHVERGFCSRCGTPLFVVDDDSAHLAITIGSLDTPDLVPILFEMGLEGHHPSLPQIDAAEQLGTTEEADGTESVAAISRTNRQHPDHDTAIWPPTE
ncbi:MAG TPA: GFA family protein [Devosia sp.]|nr:GFA family protein [Devosia sp.]